MPFKKGHTHKGNAGRKRKRSTLRRNLTDDNTTGREREIKYQKKNKNGAIDKFPITKEWDTSARYKQLDPELVDYYIYNDLDVTELFEGLKTYVTEEEAFKRQQSYYKKDNNNGNENV